MLKFLFISLVISIFPMYGQNGDVMINQNDRLDSIVKLKKELNSKIQNLRIQIYNGDRKNAEIIMKEYVEIFNDSTANIVYETPNYKIWVGNFYNQIEADKKLIEIRKKFRSAFIFRPEIIEIIDEMENKDKSELN